MFDKNTKRENVPAYHPISWPQEGVSGDTGTWRSERPVVNHDKCTKCQRCWIFCPEAVIDREKIDINYQYCKGCGICAVECPVKAITMEKED